MTSATRRVRLIALFTASMGVADALVAAWLFRSALAMTLCISALIMLMTGLVWELLRR